jgi:hypothetical protein
LVYVFVTEPRIYLHTAQRKWNTVFNINSNEWKQIYILPFKVTACTKLHWFQFRINHNILAYIYSNLCLVKWHCIHHLYILYQHRQKLQSSLKMFGLCLRKWNTVFDINSNEWKQIYILPFKVTACTKLHWSKCCVCYGNKDNMYRRIDKQL